ncbi:MAG TPA: hypothetical protein VIP09_05440, partial [Dehalococcoidia bacterium]
QAPPDPIADVQPDAVADTQPDTDSSAFPNAFAAANASSGGQLRYQDEWSERYLARTINRSIRYGGHPKRRR